MKHLHWYAHREGCCTNGAGRSVQGYIGTHTERDAVQMEQAEVYRVTLVRTQRGVLYKWSRQKCTGLDWYAHREGVVQMEQAEVYMVTLVRTQRGVLYKWSRQKFTGLHWYAHREGCCTNGAGRSVHGYISTHTERGAVQMEQAEVYWVTLVRTQRGVLYK